MVFFHIRENEKKIAIGVGLIVVSDVFACFSDYRQMLLPFYWGSMAIGVAILVWVFFQPKYYQEIFASVYKGILHKTTKNGLPTY